MAQIFNPKPENDPDEEKAKPTPPYQLTAQDWMTIFNYGGKSWDFSNPLHSNVWQEAILGATTRGLSFSHPIPSAEGRIAPQLHSLLLSPAWPYSQTRLIIERSQVLLKILPYLDSKNLNSAKDIILKEIYLIQDLSIQINILKELALHLNEDDKRKVINTALSIALRSTDNTATLNALSELIPQLERDERNIALMRVLETISPEGFKVPKLTEKESRVLQEVEEEETVEPIIHSKEQLDIQPSPEYIPSTDRIFEKQVQDLGKEAVKIVFNSDVEFDINSQTITSEIGPFFKDLEDLQYILDAIQKKESKPIKILRLQKYSPLEAVIENATTAVTTLWVDIIPWRRKHAQKMAQLDERAKIQALELAKSEGLKQAASVSIDEAEKEKLLAEAEKTRQEADKMRIENERAEWEFQLEKVKMAMQIVDKYSKDLSEEEKILFTMRLLVPLDGLMFGKLGMVSPNPSPGDKKQL